MCVFTLRQATCMHACMRGAVMYTLRQNIFDLRTHRRLPSQRSETVSHSENPESNLGPKWLTWHVAIIPSPTKAYRDILTYCHWEGAWDSVVVKALLVGGSRDRPPVVSLGTFSVATDGTMCPGVDSATKNEYQDFPAGKDGRCVRVTTLLPSQCRKSRKSEALTYRSPSGHLGRSRENVTFYCHWVTYHLTTFCELNRNIWTCKLRSYLKNTRIKGVCVCVCVSKLYCFYTIQMSMNKKARVL
jgi:hypothetical protein